ncbi:hypothetical protein L208DRAFT_56730 [Tricholoma matsutake]|nr:hypothetical protein L208DRAFT_56730 [Tricholoma matsutake 945]
MPKRRHIHFNHNDPPLFPRQILWRRTCHITHARFTCLLILLIIAHTAACVTLKARRPTSACHNRWQRSCRAHRTAVR